MATNKTKGGSWYVEPENYFPKDIRDKHFGKETTKKKPTTKTKTTTTKTTTKKK